MSLLLVLLVHGVIVHSGDVDLGGGHLVLDVVQIIFLSHGGCTISPRLDLALDRLEVRSFSASSRVNYTMVLAPSQMAILLVFVALALAHTDSVNR